MREENRRICPAARNEALGDSPEMDSLFVDADAVALGSFDGAIECAAAGGEFRLFK